MNRCNVNAESWCVNVPWCPMCHLMMDLALCSSLRRVESQNPSTKQGSVWSSSIRVGRAWRDMMDHWIQLCRVSSVFNVFPDGWRGISLVIVNKFSRLVNPWQSMRARAQLWNVVHSSMWLHPNTMRHVPSRRFEVRTSQLSLTILFLMSLVQLVLFLEAFVEQALVARPKINSSMVPSQ